MPLASDQPYIEWIRLGLFGSLRAVLFDGARLNRKRIRFKGERLAWNKPCPCGSKRKFKKCCGR
jgi:hypothetical protein